MDIRIQSPHINAGDTLESFVKDKVARLSRFSKRALYADVVLSLDNAQNGESRVCEIRLGIPGNEYVAKRNSKTFEAAVTAAVEAIENQVGKK